MQMITGAQHTPPTGTQLLVHQQKMAAKANSDTKALDRMQFAINSTRINSMADKPLRPPSTKGSRKVLIPPGRPVAKQQPSVRPMSGKKATMSVRPPSSGRRPPSGTLRPQQQRNNDNLNRYYSSMGSHNQFSPMQLSPGGDQSGGAKELLDKGHRSSPAPQKPQA